MPAGCRVHVPSRNPSSASPSVPRLNPERGLRCQPEPIRIPISQSLQAFPFAEPTSIPVSVPICKANVRDHRWLPVARLVPGEERAQAQGVTRVAIRWIALFGYFDSC